jgi:hypothetical protein
MSWVIMLLKTYGFKSIFIIFMHIVELIMCQTLCEPFAQGMTILGLYAHHGIELVLFNMINILY